MDRRAGTAPRSARSALFTSAEFEKNDVRAFPISRFRDHPPPHLHVRYAGNKATIAIETMDVISGTLPARVYGLVAEWGLRHRALLHANWRRAAAREALLAIQPLE